MKKILLLCSIILVSLSMDAQQLPLFTQYREHLSILNPAAVSADYLVYGHTVGMGTSFRRQWVGLEGAPRTQTLQGTYIHDQPGSFAWMVGGHLINDQTGPTGFTGAYGRIAGVITDDPSYGGLSIGLNFGAVQYRVKSTDIRLRESGDILTAQNQAQIYPDFGLGVYFYRQIAGGVLDDDHFYAGLSIPQVLGLNLEFEDEAGQFFTERVRHYYATLGLYHYLSDESFLEPSAWIKYSPNAPLNVDFNLRYQLRRNFWLGAGISTAGTFHLELGTLIEDFLRMDSHFKIGYGFDYSFTAFGPSAGTVHEINLAYTFDYD